MASLLQLTSKHSPVTNRNRVQPTFDKVPHRHPAAPVRGDSPRDINCVQLPPLPDRRIERHIWGTVIFRRHAMLFNQGALQYDRWQNHHGFSTVSNLRSSSVFSAQLYSVDAMRPNQQMPEIPMILSAGAERSCPDVIAELLCTSR